MTLQTLPGRERVVDEALGLFLQELTLTLDKSSEMLPSRIDETSTATTPSEPRVALTQEAAERLITKAGGFFIGARQLRQLSMVDRHTELPPIPAEFSEAFLAAAHPLREGTIAEHIIFGFDVKTSQWLCFEKSVVPGSLGTEGGGLTAEEQYQLLNDHDGRPKTVHGVEYTSPTSHGPILRVLESAIYWRRTRGGSAETLPFFGAWGRTAEDARDDRVHFVHALGMSSWNGPAWTMIDRNYRGQVGLIAGWSVPAQPKANVSNGEETTPLPEHPQTRQVQNGVPRPTRFKFVNT